MFSDSFKMKLVDDVLYEVYGKIIQRKQGSIDIAGFNSSAEKVDEGTDEAVESENDNVEEELLRDNETRLTSINHHWSESIKSLKKQAAEMLQQSCSKHSKAEIGQNVLVQIPDVDKGRLAPRNILAVVLSEREDLYQLDTSSGVLEKL
ncbi:hypothetical protein ILUMI_05979 [Ignelater luminosus]|uniref:TCTP domain-containing protein n=1 Tax=Ignelater luminosus TaxID=2038154 RepID=A0A8K0DGL1_IGNLU|nr:hypothetical protein ILUMI_05979 [Ignelater luminosus]